MRLGIAHHLGWAVAVTATERHEVVDRRRIELVGPGLPPAPVHHEGGQHQMHRHGPQLDDDALAALVAEVRASARRAASAELDDVGGIAARTDRLDVAPGLAGPLPGRDRRATPSAAREQRRLGHVPPGAGGARSRSRAGRSTSSTPGAWSARQPRSWAIAADARARAARVRRWGAAAGRRITAWRWRRRSRCREGSAQPGDRSRSPQCAVRPVEGAAGQVLVERIQASYMRV